MMIKVFSCICILILSAVLLVSFNSSKTSVVITIKDTVPVVRIQTEKMIRELGVKSICAADSVFKNLTIYNAQNRITAKQLMDTMQYWSNSLDISCNYCHKENDWASDALSAKQIARDMHKMQSTINKTLLIKIKNLASERAEINCYTCHHGSVLPFNDDALL